MSILTRLAPVIKKYGVNVEFRYFDPATRIDCPCKNNPWKQYDPEWHKKNPLAVSCLGTGFLSAVTISEVIAVVIPKYSMSGEELLSLPAGGLSEWDWVAFTQETIPVQEVVLDASHKFSVVGDFPYYVEGNKDTPTVRILLLSGKVAAVKRNG